MISNLGRHAPRDLQRELMSAYDGEVPPPYYWQIPSVPPRAHGRRHPGEMPTALPYAALPPELGRNARAISFEETAPSAEERRFRDRPQLPMAKESLISCCRSGRRIPS